MSGKVFPASELDAPSKEPPQRKGGVANFTRCRSISGNDRLSLWGGTPMREGNRIPDDIVLTRETAS